ncbi:hypothetical protein [Pseudarthrobacter phenanthrenivorans]|uniref:hypothetical protein n=1 Tax=Pseudarthrobacter phenanthrenivorans TaxID=361575 RepID=UPI002F3525CD
MNEQTTSIVGGVVYLGVLAGVMLGALSRRFDHDIGHADPSQRLVWGTLYEEICRALAIGLPRASRYAAMALTDIGRHRHELTGIAFASDPDRSGPPINIIICQLCDFTGPQTQANQ